MDHHTEWKLSELHIPSYKSEADCFLYEPYNRHDLATQYRINYRLERGCIISTDWKKTALHGLSYRPAEWRSICATIHWSLAALHKLSYTLENANVLSDRKGPFGDIRTAVQYRLCRNLCDHVYL